MTSSDPAPAADRFGARASREMAGMFDAVSARYDFLNRVMSLGRDRAWRAAMWRAVPERARVVLDLCTGSGASLAGRERGAGWAPRLVCADAFRLPLRDGALDAVTIAFGVRNLRPRAEALAEIARVTSAGGTLTVLEAVAPATGLFAPVHRFYLRHIVPLLGRISPDPSAYAYLSQSIFEFGAGPEFEDDLARAGFQVVASRSFLFGATRLWV